MLILVGLALVTGGLGGFAHWLRHVGAGSVRDLMRRWTLACDGAERAARSWRLAAPACAPR